jgi:deoxyribonuclease (pyrimidine dimer)
VTRINLVPPEDLLRWHLVAEYREVPRIFALARAWDERGRPGKLPETYRLGPGHERFFYDKLVFIARRHRLLVREMWARGYSPNFEHTLGLLLSCPRDLRQDWTPAEQDIAASWQRIKERLG